MDPFIATQVSEITSDQYKDGMEMQEAIMDLRGRLLRMPQSRTRDNALDRLAEVAMWAQTALVDPGGPPSGIDFGG